MNTLAAEEAAGEDSMAENVNNLLQSIFGLFENLSEIGATWGDPWGWLFPTFVAVGFALAFVGGIRYIFDQMQMKIRPWFFFVLLVVGALAFAAIWSSGQSTALSTVIGRFGTI